MSVLILYIVLKGMSTITFTLHHGVALRATPLDPRLPGFKKTQIPYSENFERGFGLAHAKVGIFGRFK